MTSSARPDTSTADDYCDVCGMPIDRRAARHPRRSASASAAAVGSGDVGGGRRAASQPGQPPAPTAAPPTSRTRCSARTAATTSPPAPCRGRWSPPHAGPRRTRPSEPSVAGVDLCRRRRLRHGAQAGGRPLGWVAEVWIDPAWYEAQQSPDPMPSPGLPVVVPLRHASVLGRPDLAQPRTSTPTSTASPTPGSAAGRPSSPPTAAAGGSRTWTRPTAPSSPRPADPMPEQPHPGRHEA